MLAQETGISVVTKKGPELCGKQKGWTCHSECNLLFFNPYDGGISDPSDVDDPGSGGSYYLRLDSNYDGKIDCFKNTLPDGNWNTGRAFNPPTHYGIDGAAETGTLVYSGMSGSVSQVSVQLENDSVVKYDSSRHYFESTGETWTYEEQTYFEVLLRDSTNPKLQGENKGGRALR